MKLSHLPFSVLLCITLAQISCKSMKKLDSDLSSSVSDSSLKGSLREHIEYLAGPNLKGREVGTYGSLEAARYIADFFAANELAELTGLPVVSQRQRQLIDQNMMAITDDETKAKFSRNGSFQTNNQRYSNLWRYAHLFPVTRYDTISGKKAPPVDQVYLDHDVQSYNIIGVKWARSAQKTIVIGGHFDHFGPHARNIRKNDQGELEYRCKLDPSGSTINSNKYDPNVCYGADDNAAGIAIVLEVLRVVRSQELNKNIMFVAFGAEELGDQGSQALFNTLKDRKIMPSCFERSDVPCMEAMINIDLVAYANAPTRSDLGVIGLRSFDTDQTQGFISRLLNSVGHTVVEDIQGVGMKAVVNSRSDSQIFAEHGIPTLYFSTDESRLPSYHKTSDIPENIPYDTFIPTATSIIDITIALAQSDKTIGRSQAFLDFLTKHQSAK